MDFINDILGQIMYWIDWAVAKVIPGFHNIGVCIILFTIVVYLLIYPLNSKQQKSSRLMNKINPELKEIQKKYKGKTDQASQMKMNQETQDLYAKYGVSPFGGCLPLLITMPILFSLYYVIQDIGTYVESLNPAKYPGVNNFLGLFVDMSPIDFANKFGATQKLAYLAYLVPIISVVLQFINSKMLQVKSDKKNSADDTMGQSMKMMNYFMPIMSGVICLSINMGVGLYWITGSLFRIVQAFIINRKMDKISLDELIEQNKEKAAKKSAKREQMNQQMEEYAKKRTATIKTASTYKNEASSSDDSKEEVKINKEYKPGSISGYANMLSGKKDK